MRIGLVGVGRWGRNWARVLSEAGVLGDVIDPHPTVETVTTLPEGTNVCSHIDSSLGNHDGFIVATPAPTHEALTCQLLLTGHHVLVEKPMALSTDQAARMHEAEKRSGKVLMVGHILEHHPSFVTIEKLLRDGVLGELRHISSRRMSFGRIRHDENVLWSFAPHDVAMVQRLMGKAVMSTKCTTSWTLGRGHCADIANVQLLFGNGRTAMIEVSWHSPIKEHRLQVFGSKAIVTWDDVAKTLTLQSFSMIDGELHREEPQFVMVPSQEPLRAELDAFVRAIETGKAEWADSLSGLAVIQTLEWAEAESRRAGACS